MTDIWTYIISIIFESKHHAMKDSLADCYRILSLEAEPDLDIRCDGYVPDFPIPDHK